MSTLIILIHIVVCIALIFIVLLQSGKGADMGAAFGGGSSHTLFGSTGASTFLSKMTTGAAVIFMLTSLSLAYLSSRRPASSIVPAAGPPPVTQEADEQSVPGTDQPGTTMAPEAASSGADPASAPAAPAPTSSRGAESPSPVPAGGAVPQLPANEG